MPRFDVDSYISVQDRINRFWAEYPDGRLETELVTNPGDYDRVVFKASVYKQRENSIPDATGYAAEIAGGSGANATSHHENGETSSLGRALANMGYATSDKRPSREEMQKVERMEGQPTPIRQSAPPPRPINGDGPRYSSIEQVAPPPNADGPTQKQVGFLLKIGQERGLNETALKMILGVQSFRDVSKRHMSEFIDAVQTWDEDHAQEELEMAVSAAVEAEGF